MKERLTKLIKEAQERYIYAEEQAQYLEKISKDTDRDYYMTAEEAVKYGIIDEVVKSRK